MQRPLCICGNMCKKMELVKLMAGNYTTVIAGYAQRMLNRAKYFKYKCNGE